jgi:hypothetical protein
MAKNKNTEPSAPSASGERKSNKPRKKNPRPNNFGATGRTVGGYSPAKLEERALKRKYAHLTSQK